MATPGATSLARLSSCSWASLAGCATSDSSSREAPVEATVWAISLAGSEPPRKTTRCPASAASSATNRAPRSCPSPARVATTETLAEAGTLMPWNSPSRWARMMLVAACSWAMEIRPSAQPWPSSSRTGPSTRSHSTRLENASEARPSKRTALSRSNTTKASSKAAQVRAAATPSSSAGRVDAGKRAVSCSTDSDARVPMECPCPVSCASNLRRVRSSSL